jgi:hypothetical protein
MSAPQGPAQGLADIMALFGGGMRAAPGVEPGAAPGVEPGVKPCGSCGEAARQRRIAQRAKREADQAARLTPGPGACSASSRP